MGEIPRLAISHAWFLTGVTGTSGPVWNCPFLQENCLAELKFSYMVSGSHESEKSFTAIEGLEVTTPLFLVYSTTQRELKNSQIQRRGTCIPVQGGGLWEPMFADNLWQAEAAEHSRCVCLFLHSFLLTVCTDP